MRVLPANPSAKTALSRLPLRIYVVSACVLGVLLATYFLFVQPRNRAMAEVRSGVRSQRTSLQLLEVELTKLDASRRRLQQLEKAITGFEESFPQQGEIDVILREVWVIADAAGLKTQRIKTQKEKSQEQYKILPIEMSLRGRFEGLYSFMLSLERLPGIMQIQSLGAKVVPGEENGCVEATLVLNVFCRP